MHKFRELIKQTHQSPYYDKMKRFSSILDDHFGINHFWYHKLSLSGEYTYVGTHTDWDEYCVDNIYLDYAKHLPCLNKPLCVSHGIQLLKVDGGENYKKFLDIAWEKFNINLNLTIVTHENDHLENFGFATRHKHPQSDELLLSNLSLLQEFVKIFKKENKEILRLADENRFDYAQDAGLKPTDYAVRLPYSFEKNKFLSQIGLGNILLLTDREKNILEFIASGYPASYIAKMLHLSERTVENHTSNIKIKLSCQSKVDLINIARQVASTGFFI